MTIDSLNPSAGPARQCLESAFEAEGRALIDQVGQQVGLQPGAVTLEALTLLYWLRSQPPTTRPDMDRALARWRDGDVAFKTPAQAPAFLELLLKNELLVEMGAQTKRLLVSPKGIALLSRLHRGCEDLDLPARLHRWETAWPRSEAETVGYVRAFVARQRTFVPT